MKKQRKNYKILETIKDKIHKDKKTYIIVSIIFIIGIFLGVIFINNLDNNVQNEVNLYINDYINLLKNNYEIDNIKFLQKSIINNCIFVLFIWFMGSTLIGIPIIFLMLIYKGFSLSYTISSIILTLGIGKGSIFCILSMLLQNIIIIPATICLGVSGIKIYKSVIKNKTKENIKLEIIRHSLISICLLGILIISSFVETYISNPLLILSINIL